MKKLYRYFLVFIFFLNGTSTAFANWTLHVGPVSVGAGGSNPISIPPLQVIEYEFVWINAKQRELTIGIVPGLLYGQRFYLSPNGPYVSGGGGLVFDLNGIGPGIYAALGYDLCASVVCFNMEYKKALGLTTRTLIAPYALRIGFTIKAN